MKKRIILFLVVFAVLSIMLQACGNMPRENERVFSDGSLMVNNAESQPLAPEAFHVEKGVLYIHDPVNNEIAVFDDGDKKILKPHSCDGLTDISADGGNIMLYYSDGTVLESTDGIDFSQVSADIALREYDYSLGEKEATAIDAQTGTEYSISCRYEPVEISEVYRDDKYVYFFICEGDYKNEEGVRYMRHVYRFAVNGRRCRVYDLEEAHIYIPAKYLCVDGGRVYQMLIGKDSVDIIALAGHDIAA